MFYQINFIGAMTCDDDALLKDNAIQKEMKFEIKSVFSSFEAVLKNFMETIGMDMTCIQMLSVSSGTYNGQNKAAHISN